MGKKNGLFDTEWFESRGYTYDTKNGSWNPPKFKNPLTESRAIITSDIKKDGSFTVTFKDSDLIPKLKVNNSPAFEAKPVTEWFIKGWNVPSKKNSRQNFVKNGKQISIPSKKHAEYVNGTAMQYEVFGNEFKRTVSHYKLSYPLSIEFTFVRGSKHSFDYCNAAQTVEDIMKGHWIEDDSADHIIPVFKPYEYDKEMPGVKIKILI